MITHLRGTLAERTPSYLVLEVYGLGYFVHISLFTYAQIENLEMGASLKLFIYQHFREDRQSLYGFFDTYERDIFEKLIGVTGVGLNTARVIMSTLKPQEVVQAVTNQDDQTFKRVKGVGAKTAKMIIVSLQSKLDGLEVSQPEMAAAGDHRREAEKALIILGFDKHKVSKALDTLLKRDPQLTSEALVKQSLTLI